jgi:hypothetical protein
MGINLPHIESAARNNSMARKTKRKLKKNLEEGTPFPRPARDRRRKGLNMKIASDGSMHIRHLSEPSNGLAFMPPVEIQVADLED